MKQPEEFTLLPNIEDPRIKAAIDTYRLHLRMQNEPLVYVRAHTRRWQARWKKPKPPKDDVKRAVRSFEKTLTDSMVGTTARL